MPKSESQAAAELSDTGFYRQRAELAAHSQSELINVPLDRRRRKSPPNPGSSPLSSTGSGRGSGGNKSSARSADDKSGSIPLTSRHTAQRVVTKDGIVMGANLDRHSMVYDPERAEVKERQGFNMTDGWCTEEAGSRYNVDEADGGTMNLPEPDQRVHRALQAKGQTSVIALILWSCF